MEILGLTWRLSCAFYGAYAISSSLSILIPIFKLYFSNNIVYSI
jgi:hypothetical protein